jgi:hypothetical protein
MQAEHSIARDPIFLVVAGCFALLTTALPAVFGHPWLLVGLQTAVLTILLGVALRSGSMTPAVQTLVVWSVAQAFIVILLTYFFADQVERAIRDGFALRTGTVEWLYTDAVVPFDIQAAPMRRVWEFAGVTLGSIVTGGLVGVWTLLETVNRSAFAAGALLSSLTDEVAFPVAFFPWSILRTAGYLGIVAVCAEPMWTGNWSLARIWRERRMMIIISLGILLVALLFERFFAAGWRALFV